MNGHWLTCKLHLRIIFNNIYLQICFDNVEKNLNKGEMPLKLD